MTALGDRPHHVYRCYDAAGALLYVGCTATSIERRLQRHRRTNPAVAERTVRWTTETYPTREAGLAAEAQAIYREAPLLNIRHNAKRVWRAGQTVQPSMDELREAVGRLTG